MSKALDLKLEPLQAQRTLAGLAVPEKLSPQLSGLKERIARASGDARGLAEVLATKLAQVRVGPQQDLLRLRARRICDDGQPRPADLLQVLLQLLRGVTFRRDCIGGQHNPEIGFSFFGQGDGR